ncbi:unnamed protein product [Durusdinium trenchii]|uniref:PA14 domain-containing protein n=1 Tax=Durusdinium trenchii TaxID=1381693 RepID=A0ABP0RM57_9DINO
MSYIPYILSLDCHGIVCAMQAASRSRREDISLRRPGVPVEHRPAAEAVPVVAQHTTVASMPEPASPTVQPAVEAVPVVPQHTKVASMPEPASPTVQPAAVPVVPLPTSTVTFTTTPPVLRPVDVGAALEQGLVGELFDFKTKTSTVAVIDHTVHHWGDVYSALAIKWKGFLFIRKPGHYRFQITCLGAAELRIDGAILIKEDALMLARASIPSTTVTLPAGYHSILIGYTELEGQAGFAINYIGPDTEDEPQPQTGYDDNLAVVPDWRGALEYVGALARSQQRFPSGLANTLPRPLQQPPAGSCMHLKHICCAKDDWRLMHEVEREIQAASYKKEGDALGFHRSKKHKVAYGEALSDAPAFVSLVKHALAIFDLTLVDCWANL